VGGAIYPVKRRHIVGHGLPLAPEGKSKPEEGTFPEVTLYFDLKKARGN